MAKQNNQGLENREIVLDILTEVLERGTFVHLVLNRALEKYQYLDKADRSFITRTTEGTLEYLIQIDYIIDLYAKTKTQKMKPVIRNLLRLSVYQILYMDRVPDSAVCNEAVRLAQKRRFQGLKGFVNGVLRTISREKETIVFPDPWLELSLPKWMYRMWEKQYGTELTKTMGQSFLQPSGTTVRCNFGKIRAEYPDREPMEVLRDSLESQGVRVQDFPLLPGMMTISGYDYLGGLTAFGRGWIQVQDPSSAFVGQLAAPREGDYVLDVCAAPGGKSLHMAELLQGTGMVEARDLTPQKVALIEENIARCGYTNIRTAVMDALEEDPDSIGCADLVLADLPCSGLGILGRKPDIKNHITWEKMEELAALQRRILSVVWRYVKPGGRLVFSTCTIDPMENEKNAAWFAAEFPFKPVDLRPQVNGRLEAHSLKDGWIQFLPGRDPMDGFFISVFERLPEEV